MYLKKIYIKSILILNNFFIYEIKDLYFLEGFFGLSRLKDILGFSVFFAAQVRKKSVIGLKIYFSSDPEQMVQSSKK